MKRILIILPLLAFSFMLNAEEKIENLRYVEVTGSAEMEVEPDEIMLSVGLKEYWQPKNKNKKDSEVDDNYDAYDDYSYGREKMPIADIEKNFIKDLEKLGVTSKQITISNVGDYWRWWWDNNYLIEKQLEIKYTDLPKVNQTINSLKTKGISYMHIGSLKNKDIVKYRKEVKIEALKSAKAKAEYLLESLGKKVGEPIYIIEVNDDYWGGWYRNSAMSNSISQSMMNSPSGSDSDVENYKKIKLRYEMKVRFEIK